MPLKSCVVFTWKICSKSQEICHLMYNLELHVNTVMKFLLEQYLSLTIDEHALYFITVEWMTRSYKDYMLFFITCASQEWINLMNEWMNVYELSLKLTCFLKLIRIKSSDKPSVQSKDMSFICNPHLLGKPCFPILKFALLKNFIRFSFILYS